MHSHQITRLDSATPISHIGVCFEKLPGLPQDQGRLVICQSFTVTLNARESNQSSATTLDTISTVSGYVFLRLASGSRSSRETSSPLVYIVIRH
jgi:hypothetical protein